MNDRDLRKKKHSQSHIKTGSQKHVHHKIGAACEPKNPPFIPPHLRQLENTRKKQYHYIRELRISEENVYYEENQNALRHSRAPRTSNLKNLQETNAKKKNKNISKNKTKSNIQSRQNRENKEINSNLNINLKRTEKMMTENSSSEQKMLFCPEKITVKKKSKLQPRVSSEHIGTSSQIQIASKKCHKKTFEQEIAEFQAQINSVTTEAEVQSLSQIFQKEQLYSRIENYNCFLEKKQPEISWIRRAIVVNWMMEICRDFSCKREVFALAVNYLDRYLTLTEEIKLKNLQLVACGALTLANKNEGPRFRIADLVQLVGEIETEDIVSMQETMAFKLAFRLHPPTTNMWANRIALQWDMYIDHQICLTEILQEHFDDIKFKNMETKSYHNYRSLVAYVDFSLLDVHTLQYHCRELSASFIYIILLINLGVYQREQILQTFPKSSKFILQQTEFNVFYSQFLKDSFGFSLQDLLPTVQFCATFMFLKVTYELPPAVEGLREEEDLDFSEFCSFQTCNQYYLQSLKERNRQFD